MTITEAHPYHGMSEEGRLNLDMGGNTVVWPKYDECCPLCRAERGRARAGDWIQTFSGIAFWPLDPRPDEIHIEDIAHALAMQCRFTGHVRRFYSVAEHSIHVSLLCDPSDALWGLLHDASEAYLVDVARPLKRLFMMDEYRAIERNLQAAIAQRFGLSPDQPESVGRADRVMASIEGRDLLPTVKPQYRDMHAERWRDWLPLIGSCGLVLSQPWSPEEAEARFLARFRQLTEPLEKVA
jgi:hypothetical protein